MNKLSWHRTPLLTIVFFAAKEIRALVRNITNLLPVLAAVVVTDKLWVTYSVIGAYLTYIVIRAVLNQRYFLYSLADDAIHLRSGILGKTNLTLKYERIQQAEIDQSWYLRPFGLVTLRIDSAGSAGKEVEIPGLSMTRAHYLRERMLDGTATADATTECVADTDAVAEQAVDTAVTKPVKHIQFPLGEVFRAGLIDNKIFVIFAVLMYPITQGDFFEELVIPWLTKQLSFIQSSAIMSIGIVVLTILVMFFIAIGLTMLRYYSLQLTVVDQLYQARMGLLSIRTLGFRYEKLQRVQIRQNIRSRLLRRYTASVNQLQPRATGQQQESTTFVLPILTVEQLSQFCQWLGLPRTDTLLWQKIHFISLLHPSFWIALTAPAIALTCYLNDVTGLVSLAIAAGTWVLLQAYAVARWHRYGFVIEHGWLAKRHGVFGRKENWYPLYKAQQISVYQSPWLRVLGYAHLVIHSAAGTEMIKYQPYQTAVALQQEWVQRIGTDFRRWM